LRREHWLAMQAHVQAQAPLEACGLLAGRGRMVEEVLIISNLARSPVRYRMDPREQWLAFNHIESNGRKLVGIFHSHPAGPATVSATDMAEAAYPVVQLIWFRRGGQWSTRAFWIQGGQASDVALQVTDAE
jgi:proteasome lid subunit RPN8/RPN11